MRKNLILAGIFGLVLLGLSLILSTVSPDVKQAEANGTNKVNLLPFADNSLGLMAVNGPIKVAGTKFVDGSGKPFFVMGANYVGHTDRAWLMWENGKFDANLITQNFQLASEAGLNTIRIFVMKPLRDDINANNFAKLDKVFEIAAAKNLYLILTFNDYDEPDLAKEAQLNKKIAARYGNNPNLLAYDLKNEPQFINITTAIFPVGTNVPLQKDDFIKAYGERMSQSAVDAWRQTAEGRSVVPSRLDARSGYLYANAYKLYLEFLDDSGKWVLSHSGKTTLDYIDTPEAGKWGVYLTALSDTVGAWIDTRMGPIREVDGETPSTIGWSNAILAKMRSNDKLGFVSLHRFVGEGYSGLIATMNLLENLKASFSQRPVILEEFGYSNARSDNSAVPTNVTANYETALWLFLASKNYAGGVKWMLVNFPSGFNQVQNNYGLLDNNTQPKPSYHALKAVTAYIQMENQTPVGTLANLKADGTNLLYQYNGARGIFNNATSWQTGPVRYTQPVSSPFAAYWPSSGAGEVNVLTTQPAPVTVDVDALYPQRNKTAQAVLTSSGLPDQPLNPVNGLVTFTAEPNRFYTLRVPVQPPAFARTEPLGQGSWYFKETGHNLKGAFLSYWQKNGGLAIYGYPISEEFMENGFVVQYFERNRFEYHPENRGTKYEVLLGLLGRNVTAGREGEAKFQRIPAFQSNPNSLYFAETGHSLSFGFRIYWEKNGGLAQFGYPISEEFTELNPADNKTYTVQYFERARFEYHPEFKNTPFETLLGLLGWQVAKGRGWL